VVARSPSALMGRYGAGVLLAEIERDLGQSLANR
jgi:hypothetical protein